MYAKYVIIIINYIVIFIIVYIELNLRINT